MSMITMLNQHTNDEMLHQEHKPALHDRELEAPTISSDSETSSDSEAETSSDSGSETSSSSAFSKKSGLSKKSAIAAAVVGGVVAALIAVAAIGVFCCAKKDSEEGSTKQKANVLGSSISMTVSSDSLKPSSPTSSVFTGSNSDNSIPPSSSSGATNHSQDSTSESEASEQENRLLVRKAALPLAGEASGPEKIGKGTFKFVFEEQTLLFDESNGLVSQENGFEFGEVLYSKQNNEYLLFDDEIETNYDDEIETNYDDEIETNYSVYNLTPLVEMWRGERPSTSDSKPPRLGDLKCGTWYWQYSDQMSSDELDNIRSYPRISEMLESSRKVFYKNAEETFPLAFEGKEPITSGFEELTAQGEEENYSEQERKSFVLSKAKIEEGKFIFAEERTLSWDEADNELYDSLSEGDSFGFMFYSKERNEYLLLDHEKNVYDLSSLVERGSELASTTEHAPSLSDYKRGTWESDTITDLRDAGSAERGSAERVLFTETSSGDVFHFTFEVEKAKDSNAFIAGDVHDQLLAGLEDEGDLEV